MATIAVHSEIGAFLRSLLRRTLVRHPPPATRPPALRAALSASDSEGVQPRALMAAIQRVIVRGSDLPLIAEPSSAMARGAHLLAFDRPGRWRVSNSFGAMGHGIGGVLGIAKAHGNGAVLLTGDGSALMHDEISTAVRYAIKVVHIVLNDARYGLPAHGMRLTGHDCCDAEIARVDFAPCARSVGADGVRVERADQLDGGLRAALASAGPFVVDVLIDGRVVPPVGTRLKVLRNQESCDRKPAMNQPAHGSQHGPCPPADPIARSELARFPALPGLGASRPHALIGALAQQPPLMSAVPALARMLMTEGALTPRDREIVVLRVAWVIASDYVWGGHVRVGLGAGVTEPELEQVAAGPGDRRWRGSDRTLLAACDELLAGGRLGARTQ